MEPRKLLLPINVKKCRPAVFNVVNRFARDSQLTVILLHVVTLNVMGSENRVYEELAAEADSCLQALSAQYIRPEILTVRRVRIGKAAEEILRQAAVDKPNLMIMTVGKPFSHRGSLIRRLQLSTATRSWTVRRVLQKAPCDILIMPIAGEFDCEQAWGGQTNAPSLGLDVPTAHVGRLPAR